MSRPKFLADQDFNDQILNGVRRLEPAAEIVRLRDVGLSQTPDPGVLEYAATHGFILLSHDVNTMRGHACARMAEGRKLAGLLLVKQTHPVASVIEDLVLIWVATDAQEWLNRIEFLPMPRHAS